MGKSDWLLRNTNEAMNKRIAGEVPPPARESPMSEPRDAMRETSALPSLGGSAPTEASEHARNLVSNHERVAMAYRRLGATELGEAENAVLDYIAGLEAEVARLRATLPSEGARP